MSADPRKTWQVPTERAGEALVRDVTSIDAVGSGTARAGAAIALGLFRLAEAIERLTEDREGPRDES